MWNKYIHFYDTYLYLRIAGTMDDERIIIHNLMLNVGRSKLLFANAVVDFLFVCIISCIYSSTNVMQTIHMFSVSFYFSLSEGDDKNPIFMQN